MRMTRKKARRLRHKNERNERNEQRRLARLILGAGLLLGTSANAFAMPQGGTVAAGAAEVARQGAEMAIRQMTQNAVINWQSFNIAAGERVNILQPNAQAALLNRVIGGSPSAIFGALSANGRVFVVNPAGILFAQGAQVNVGSLVASTLQISDADFMAGRYAFLGDKDSGKVINQGKLLAENAGTVALLAPQVENDGVIVAKKGKAELAAGTAVSLDFTGDGKLSVLPSQEAIDAAVTNKGLVEADGGLVFLTAQTGENLVGSVVNQEGIVRARSLGTAGASEAPETGKVQIAAHDVHLGGASVIDATGASGGTVEVGGGWQGGGALAHAKNVTMDAGAAIHADATADGGAGGTVALWSDGRASFSGTITARGKGTGAGGAVETSGHDLAVAGTVDASSEQGKAGEWLLDPANIDIESDANANPPTQTISGGTTTATAGTTKLRASNIANVLNGGTSVTLKTGGTSSFAGNITVNAPIAKTAGGDAKLSFEAAQDIVLNADITSTSGKLSLDFKSDTDSVGGGSISANAVHLTTNGGTLLFHGGTMFDGIGYASSDNTAAGIALNGTQIATAGGAVNMQGNAADGSKQGIELHGATVDAGTGTVNLLAHHNQTAGTDLLVDATSAVKGTDVSLTANRVNLTGTFTGTGAGKFTLLPRTLGKDIAIGGTAANALNLPATFFSGTQVTGFDAIELGSTNGTGTVSVAAPATLGGNLVLRAGGAGGKVLISAPLNVTGHTLTLAAGAQAKATGAITANEVKLDAENADVDLSAGNSIDAITGKAKTLKAKNAGNISLATATDALTIKNGASSVETTAGDITVGAAGVKATEAANLVLTTAAANSVKLAANATLSGTGTNPLNLALKAGTLDLGSSSSIDATGGKVTLSVGALTLPSSETNLIKSQNGTLSVDTYATGGAIALGIASPAAGALSLPRLDFAAPGFSSIAVGSSSTGTVTVGNAQATSPLAIESGTAISFDAGANGVSGTAIGTANEALSFRAPSIDFASAQNITAGSGNITMEADAITNWGNAAFPGASSASSTLTVKRKTLGTDYAIGTGGWLDNTALAKMEAGNFYNVVIGDKADAGKMTVGALTALPAYTSLLAKGGVAFTGPMTSGLGTGKTLVVYSENGMTESAAPAVAPLAVDDFLLWGKGDFALATQVNEVKHLAMDLTEGSVSFQNHGDLHTSSIVNRNTGATQAGIDAKTVKIAVEGGTLDVAEKIHTTDTASLTSDFMTIAPGKLKTNELHLNKKTQTQDIAFGTGAGQWDLTGSTFNDLKVGGSTYQGNISLNNVTFSGNTELETTKKVTLTGTNNIGTGTPKKDLTITAESAKLPATTDTLSVKKLTLNLSGGLDLGAGKVHGSGALTLGGMAANQNIFVSNTYDKVTDPNPGGYKVAYTTLNNVLSGFDAISLDGPANVYFDAGSLTASVKIGAHDDIILRDNVSIEGAASAVEFSAGRDFTINTGRALSLNGTASNMKFDVTAGRNVTLEANAKINVAKPMTATLKAEHGKVLFDAGSALDITATTGSPSVTIRAQETEIGSGSKINLGNGSGGSFTLETDELTDAPTDGITNITGKGTLAVQPMTTGRAMRIDNSTTPVTGALHLTNDQLNDGLFGRTFSKLIFGSTNDSSGVAGDVTVDGLHISAGGTTNVNLVARDTVHVGANGLTLGDGARINVRAGAIENAPVGAAPAGKLTVGNNSALHLYVDNVDGMQASTDASGVSTPAFVGNGGILGLRTWDTNKTIALGDHVTGDMKLTNNFFKTVVGTGFKEYDFGQGAKDGSGLTQSVIDVGDFDIGADRSKLSYLTANQINFKGKFVQGGTASVVIRTRGEAKEEAGASIEAKNVLLNFSGKYNLDGDNKIETAAATDVKDVSLTSDALKVGKVEQAGGSVSGITSSGNIKLTTDALTLEKQIKASNKELTIQQKTLTRDLYLGTGTTAGLSLEAGAFDGSGVKLVDGFSHITLGRADGTGKAHLDGALKFHDPTTIYGLSGVELQNATVDGNGNAVSMFGKELKTDAASTLTAGAGDLTLGVDTLKVPGAANGAARIFGTGRLNLKTYTQDRDLYLEDASTTHAGTLNGLNLFSSYFEDGTTNERVFRDGFSLITIGDENATGTLHQSGTIGFTDPVNIVQALSSSAGGVSISGSIDTHGNDYSVKSRKVTFQNVHITNYAGTGGGNPKTSITTDEFVVDEASRIESDGTVAFSTYTPGKQIRIGTPAASGGGASDPLTLNPSLFSGTGLLAPGTNGRKFQSISIGDTTSGNIAIDGLSVGSGLTQNVSLISGGAVTGTGAMTGVPKLTITAHDASLTNASNEIESLGKVTTTGAFDLVTKGGVTITDAIASGSGAVHIVNKTSGDITLGANGTIATTHNTPVYLTAENGFFKNKHATGTTPISVPGSKYVISTKDSVGNEEGNLNVTVNFRRYGTAYDTHSIAGYTGNGFVYAEQPTVTVYSERAYGYGNQAFFGTNDKFSFTTKKLAGDTDATKALRDSIDAVGLTNLKNRIMTNASGTTNWGTLTGTTDANAEKDGSLRPGKGRFGNMAGAAIHVSYNDDATTNPLNYKINLEYRVTPAPLTIKANDDVRTYSGTGGAGYTGDSGTNGHGYTVSGLVLGNTFAQVADIHQIIYGTPATAGKTSATGAKNAGEYAIGLAGSNVTLKTNNYYLNFVDGKLTINKLPLVLRSNDVTQIYGALPATLSGTIQSGSLAAGDTFSSLTVGVDPTTPIGVGTPATIVVTGETILDANGTNVAANYAVTHQTGTLTVTPRDLYIKAGDKERTYGAANVTATYRGTPYSVRAADGVSGLVLGDAVAGVSGEAISATVTEASDAGKYAGATTLTGATLANPAHAGNYVFHYDAGDFYINKALVRVKANDASKVYDGAVYTGNNGATYTGFLFGQNETTASGMTGTISYAAKDAAGNTALHAGSYDLNLSGTLDSTNYTFAYDKGALAITPRPLTVKAPNAARLYGQDNSAANLSGAITAGTLAAGDSLAPLAVTTTATKASDVGSYALMLSPGGVSFAAGSTATAGDYAITAQAGTLAVNPRPLTLRAGDKERVYGMANSSAVYTNGTAKFRADSATAASGLVNGDAIADAVEYIDANATLTADAGTPNLSVSLKDGAGNAQLTFSKGKSSNYAISYVDGTLSIVPRLVVLAAKDATRDYGEPNPLPEVSVLPATSDTGLLFGTAITGLSGYYDASIGPTTSGGRYEGVIHPAQSGWALTGGNLNNYRFQYRPAALTISLKGFLPGTPEGTVTTEAGAVSGATSRTMGGGDTSASGAGSAVTSVPGGIPSAHGGDVLTNLTGLPSLGEGGTESTASVTNALIPSTPNQVAIQVGGSATEHPLSVGADGSIHFDLSKGASGAGGTASGTAGGSAGGASDVTAGAGGNAGNAGSSGSPTYSLPGMGGADEERGKTRNVIPVLFTDGESKKLNGMYQVDYSSQELAITPSEQKAPIPSPKELQEGAVNNFRIAYQSMGGDYEIDFGNGIIMLYPTNDTAYQLIHSDNHAAERALLATGVLTAIEEMGVMPEQIRAIYINTEEKAADTNPKV